MKHAPDTPLDRLTPEELAARSQRGSAEAFERLVGIFEARLYNFLLRRVGSRADAEDLTQESFLRAWKRIGSYRSKWKFSTWLYTIATRLAISHARRGNLKAGAIDPDARAAPENGVASEGATRSRVWRLVDEKLTQEQRTAVWLRYVEDLAIGEIGTVLGKSDVAVRVMLFRARAVLAEHLEPREDKVPEAAQDVPEVRRRVAGGVR